MIPTREQFDAAVPHVAIWPPFQLDATDTEEREQILDWLESFYRSAIDTSDQ